MDGTCRNKETSNKRGTEHNRLDNIHPSCSCGISPRPNHLDRYLSDTARNDRAPEFFEHTRTTARHSTLILQFKPECVSEANDARDTKHRRITTYLTQ